jgi:hypothetical protein
MARNSCILLVLLGLLCGGGRSENMSASALALRITGVTLEGTVITNIANTSVQPIRIWKDSNSWGVDRWHIFRLREGTLKTFSQDSKKIFTRNVPRFDEIAGGAHLQQTFDLNGGDWQSPADGKVTFQSGDIVIVVYDIPQSPEARRMNVWCGFAAASTSAR